MRTIVFVRHGSSVRIGSELRLSRDGSTQIERLAQRLRELIPGNEILIGASTAARTNDTAQIVARKFGAPFREHPVLNCEVEHVDFGRLHALINDYEPCATLILVTHGPYCVDGPILYILDRFNRNIDPKMVGEGGAAIIDCERGTVNVINQRDLTG